MVNDVANEKKYKLSQRVSKFFVTNFFWVVLVLSFLILLLGFVFLIWPKYQEVSNSSHYNAEQLKIYSKNNQLYLDKINNLLVAYKNISSSDVGKINKILPICGSEEGLFTQIDQIVKQSGLLLNSISIKLINSKDKVASDTRAVNTVKINLTLSGVSYNSLKIVLKGLESNLRIMDVQKLNFNPKNYSLNLEVNTYCLKN